MLAHPVAIAAILGISTATSLLIIGDVAMRDKRQKALDHGAQLCHKVCPVKLPEVESCIVGRNGLVVVCAAPDGTVLAKRIFKE